MSMDFRFYRNFETANRKFLSQTQAAIGIGIGIKVGLSFSESEVRVFVTPTKVISIVAFCTFQLLFPTKIFF